MSFEFISGEFFQVNKPPPFQQITVEPANSRLEELFKPPLQQLIVQSIGNYSQVNNSPQAFLIDLSDKESMIMFKKEQFRNQLRKSQLENEFALKRNNTNRSQNSLKSIQKKCPYHDESKVCEFHNIFYTLEIFTYSFREEWQIKRQYDYYRLMNKINNIQSLKKFKYLTILAQVMKMKIIIFNKKRKFIYGNNYNDRIYLNQKGDEYQIRNPYIQKREAQSINQSIIQNQLNQWSNSNQIIQVQKRSQPDQKSGKYLKKLNDIRKFYIKKVKKIIRNLKFVRKLPKIIKDKKFISQNNIQRNKSLIFEESSQQRRFHVDPLQNNMNLQAGICSQNIKSYTPNKELIILSWNVSSIKSNSLNEAKQKGGHILCLQETRKEIANSPSYTYYNKLRKQNPNRGGGITTGIHKQFFSKNIQNLLLQFHEKLECLLIHVSGQQLELFTFNIYSPKEQYYQKSRKALENFILQLMQSKSKALFILCGDISYPINQLSFMKDIIPAQQYTFKRIIEQREVKSKTDCIMVNQNIQAHLNTYETNQSDHLILQAKIKLQKSHLSTKQYQFYPIKQNIFILNSQANQNQLFKVFYQEIIQKMNRIQCFQRATQTLKRIRQNQNQSIKDTLQSIEQQIRSNESREGLQNNKQTFNYESFQTRWQHNELVHRWGFSYQQQ